MNQTDSTDDAAIVADVVAGDRERFAVLVRRYHAPLLRVASSRVGKPQLAEDLVQETFLAAFKSLHTYDAKYSFRTWLWTILLNQCRRALTKHHRREAIVAQSATTADWEQQLVDEEAETPEARLVEEDQRAQLDSMLDRLPEEQAIALRLRFLGGLKFQEIADAMHCSLTTAKSRVRVGLQGIAQNLNDQATNDRNQRESAATSRRCVDSIEPKHPQGNSAPEELL